MTDPKIVIVGFMGSGKSRVARELSLMLKRSFVDLDEFIVNHHGRTPKEIIEQDGEASFRELESQALEKTLTRSDAPIVAVGGGAWTVERNRQLIRKYEALSFWLDTPFEVCWQRIEAGPERRPLAPSREQAVSLFQERQAVYALADTRIKISGNEDPGAIAAQIAAAYLDCSPKP